MKHLRAPRPDRPSKALTSPVAFLTPLAFSLLCAGVSAAWAQALPTNGVVVGGSATIAPSGATTLNVSQGTNRAIIHWGSFSVDTGHTVNFRQPGADSITLNRVVGGDGPAPGSEILGNINAPGRVFIINPSGVLFGANAQVNVGGLVASTLDLAGDSMQARNAAFMAGGERFVFGSTDEELPGTVVNQGALIASGRNGQGGLLALVAPLVVNTGSMRADGGTVALGAGASVTLDVGGDGLTKLIVSDGQRGLGSVHVDGGRISADGGRVALSASGGGTRLGGSVLVRNGALIAANTMYERNGEIILDGGNDGGVIVSLSRIEARGNGAEQTGGRIDVRAGNVYLSSQGSDSDVGTPMERTTLDVSGSAGAGRVHLEASAREGVPNSGGLVVDEASVILANALGTGRGGDVIVHGDRAVLAYGAISARGGASSGDGGSVETSVGPRAGNAGGVTQTGMSLDGIRVDAGADHGRAGQWAVIGADVDIVHRDATGVWPPVGSTSAQPPVVGVTLQDADVNAALDTGTSVSAHSLAGGSGGGALTLADGVVIARTQGQQEVGFAVNAEGDIRTRGPAVIRSDTSAPLHVDMHAGSTGQSHDIRFSGSIQTQGGAVHMTTGDVSAPAGSIMLDAAVVDTRVGRATGGAPVTLRSGAVALNGTQLHGGSGDVSLTGSQGEAYGVRIGQGSTEPASRIDTSTGKIIVRGHAVGTEGGAGVSLDSGASIVSDAGGQVELTGSAASASPGVRIGSGADAAIRTGGDVMVRAHNDGAGDALVLGRPVEAGGMINLRPGEVRADGLASDVVSAPIAVGGVAGNGFSVTADEFARLSAPDVVLGSNQHAGSITLAGEVTSSRAVTLQAEGAGGRIALQAPLSAQRVGLLADGSITQTGAAPVRAQTLLARSARGDVLLDQAPNNVSDNTLGGSAGGAFRYQDEDALRVGEVSVTGADAATNTAQSITSGRLEADTVFVRTQSQDLTLATDVSSRTGADLVAAERFHNPSNHTVTGAPWRIWAVTWEGETRGGLAGSGDTPNLYGCAWSGTCGVSVTPADSHFIYEQQPTVTMTMLDAWRYQGEPNPPLPYAVTGGLVNGDTHAALSGGASTPATPSSPPGHYPITGAFTSASGYRVNVIPGTLAVNFRPVLIVPEFIRDEPNTYTFDSNLGNAPICFATGPLVGDRAQQGGDLLASEWSRVRSRPSITSCIDTERRNTCGDF